MLCIEYENQKNTLQSTFINDVLSWGYTHFSVYASQIIFKEVHKRAPVFACLLNNWVCRDEMVSSSKVSSFLSIRRSVPGTRMAAQRARPHDNSLPVSVVLQSPARQHEAASLVITGTNVEIFIQLENWLESNDEDNSLHDPCVYYNISISLR